MERRAVAAVFILLFIGILLLVGMEFLTKYIGGTPLMIVCYVLVGIGLAAYLIKMKKSEPEDEKGEREEEEDADL